MSERMVLLWFTTIFPPVNPNSSQHVLYASFFLLSIGAGGIRASSAIFGADRLEKGSTLRTAGLLQSYFNWYAFATMGAYIVAVTCIVYIQDHLGWNFGFGIPVVLTLLSVISFFWASSYYVKEKPHTNLILSLVQVVVAYYKNRHVKLSKTTEDILLGREDSELLMPSDKLRYIYLNLSAFS